MSYFNAILCIVWWDDSLPIILIAGVDVPLNATTINESLEVSQVSNAEYESKLGEIDLESLKYTLVEHAH